ncbi:autotransporter outer membrane beta-barrel domain-containing protein [Stenotrophomonas sp.]|uniref:autotransporter family protein n=1 Tax=Stenotrophomonas sp. TaxID=69392 RepID=UPI0028A5CD40|nr:autotransporter outer membrane beta-barrel domain-containing protein [Stenotrophomonas sp.]
MNLTSTCGHRRVLSTAIAVTLAALPLAASAGSLTGPGSTHTIHPGDARELWTVEDGAELTIAPGGATGGVQVDNARVIGTGVDMTGLFGIRVANGGEATLNGGQMVFTSSASDAGGVSSGSRMRIDAMTVTSAGRGFAATGAGSELILGNTLLSTGGEALQVSDGARLVLDTVTASSDGSAGGALGYALDMDGGRAEVTNSTLSGTTAGIRMDDGTLLLTGSTVQSSRTGLILSGTPNGSPSSPVAEVFDSSILAANGATLGRNATLTASGTRIRGDASLGGGTASGIGVDLTDGRFTALQGSSIEGSTSAIRLAGSAAGTNAVDISASNVRSDIGPAISMQLGGNANITVRDGARVEGGNGVALDVGALATANLDVAGSQIVGDIVGRTQGTNNRATVNVSLTDGATLRGAIVNGTDVQLDGAGWLLTGDSSMQQLTVGGGSVIEFGDGTAFHTLQVTGDYTGAGGTLVFNTVLAGDDAASDTLVIGGDSSGQTNVRVNNVGGVGALTSQGIELIDVAGASNGTFDLSGRAVGGIYEYFLFKDAGNGNWYLRSALEQVPSLPDQCVIDPQLPQCVDPPTPDPEPVPVLRPEPGAYLANLQAAEGMFRLGYHEREAGQNGGRAWARVDGSRNRFDADSRQLDVHGSSQALSVGTALLRTPQGSGVGVMLSSGNASRTSTSELTGYAARGKVRGTALGVYGTWRAGGNGDPYGGFYLDGSLQHARFSNRVEGTALATERYDSRAWQGALEVGHAFRIGRSGSASMLFVEPQLQVGYTRWNDVQHREQNGTVMTSDDANGVFGRVGVRVSGVTRWEGSAARVQPYIAAHWLRTGADARVLMDDERVDARIPRDRAEVSAGASITFAGGLGAWAGLALQQGQGYRQRTAQLGMSYEW